jgi:hypothetical protein
VSTVFSGSEHRDLCRQCSVVVSTGICVESSLVVSTGICVDSVQW